MHQLLEEIIPLDRFSTDRSQIDISRVSLHVYIYFSFSVACSISYLSLSTLDVSIITVLFIKSYN